MQIGDMVAAYPADGGKPEVGRIEYIGYSGVTVLIEGETWRYNQSQIHPVKRITQWIDAVTLELVGPPIVDWEG